MVVCAEDSEDQGQGQAKREDEEPFDLCFDKLEDFASTVQQLPLAVQLVQVGLLCTVQYARRGVLFSPEVCFTVNGIYILATTAAVSAVVSGEVLFLAPSIF